MAIEYKFTTGKEMSRQDDGNAPATAHYIKN